MMTMPNKMMVFETSAQARHAQSHLGPEWFVTTYEQGRAGQRVDLILFIRPSMAKSEMKLAEIEQGRQFLMLALKPGGGCLTLP